MSRIIRVAIRTGRFYDGTSAPPRANVTLVVENHRVARIAHGGDRIEADRSYEARVLAPGINSHVHLELNGEADTLGVYIVRNAKERGLYAAANSRLALHAGVTTGARLGAPRTRRRSRCARRSTRRARRPPPIIAAGKALAMTGGHGFFLGRETDGPWDARKGVREQRKAGADCIKLIATGGVLTKGAVPGQDQLSEERCGRRSRRWRRTGCV
jgi:hypothetical protein